MSTAALISLATVACLLAVVGGYLSWDARRKLREAARVLSDAHALADRVLKDLERAMVYASPNVTPLRESSRG